MIKVYQGEAPKCLYRMKTDSVDLVVTSPPYLNQRSYEGKVHFSTVGEYLDWSGQVIQECCRVSKGPVCWVVEGYTRRGSFTPLPELIASHCYWKGINVRKRNIYFRYGTPGGSKYDLADHHELVLMFSRKGGPLPYADPKACGHPPKFGPGGGMTHRGTNDERADGRQYKPPKICKASNVINCGSLGSNMDESSALSAIANSNEAPFSNKLAKVLIETWCPAGGVVMDPFCGSGTTLKEAFISGRRAIGFDLRDSQVKLSQERIRIAKENYDAGK